MTRVAELFAAATMVLEDVHPVAVAGQRRDLAPDAARALVIRLRGIPGPVYLLAAILEQWLPLQG